MALALGEGGLRVLRLPRRFARPRHLESADKRAGLDAYPTNPRGYFDLDLRDPAVRAPFERAGVRGMSGLSLVPHGVAFQYNDELCRDRPRTPRTPGVARVVVIGDSFAEGQGVRERDTLARALERDLQRGGARVEVWNCGRRGYDFPELFDRFERVLVYEPDVVLYTMTLNDAAQSPAFHAQQAFLNDWVLDRRRMLDDDESAKFPWWRSRIAALIDDVRASRRVADATTAWYRDMYAAPNAEGWARTQDYLRRMDAAMHARGGSLVVGLWPLFVDWRGGYPFADVSHEIARACRDAGITFRDGFAAMSVQPASRYWVHPVDLHPNERAQARFAEDLAPVVQRALTQASRRDN